MELLRTQLEDARVERERLEASQAALQAELQAAQAKAAQLGRELSKRRSQDGGLADAAAAAGAATSEALARLAEEASAMRSCGMFKIDVQQHTDNC